jgi:hypothetical protein
MPDRFFSIENRAGETHTAGGYAVTPFNHVISLRIPGWKAVAAWIRPVSVLVKKPDGEEQVLPVVDVTRAAELTLLGAGIGVPLLALLLSRRR